jgi:hypothetical protein
VVSKKTVQCSLALILVALSAFASATGCGGVVTSVCDRICFCQQCSVVDRDTCEEKGEAARRTADDRGCGRQFEAYATCLDTQVRCEGTRATTEECLEELSVVNKCTQQTMPPFGSSGGTGGG